MPSLRREEMSMVAVQGDYRSTRPAGTGYHTGDLAVDERVRVPLKNQFRPLRNNVPEVPYAYRERSYPWAQRMLAAAEAVHGRPGDKPAPTAAELMARRAAQARKQAEWRRKRKLR